VDGRFAGWLCFADTARAEAPAVLHELRRLGLHRQVLLSGDRAAVARSIGESLKLDEIHAGLLPEDKLALVRAQTARGGRPLVVGDGVNDALALRAGAVGVALGGHGTDVALASADVVLMSGDLTRLPTCIRLAKASRSTILTNVIIGLAWTVFVVIGAIAGLYGPVIAVLIHTLGTLIVLANAGRLLRFEEHDT
jgi:P-type E1-E2 ATPase